MKNVAHWSNAARAALETPPTSNMNRLAQIRIRKTFASFDANANVDANV